MISPLRLLAYLFILFFGVHFIMGTIKCAYSFCPGDNESDWVYEFTDEDGKRFIVLDDKPILKDTYERNLGIGKYSPGEEK